MGVQEFSESDFLPVMQTGEEVAASIAKRFGVSVKEMLGVKRDQHVMRARRVLYRKLHEELHWSYSSIGRFVGGRDHTTVRQVLLYETDEEFRMERKLRHTSER
jgi:chromosomal replication initiation ATPase DnaA